jgi:hypothetical protein
LSETGETQGASTIKYIKEKNVQNNNVIKGITEKKLKLQP